MKALDVERGMARSERGEAANMGAEEDARSAILPKSKRQRVRTSSRAEGRASRTRIRTRIRNRTRLDQTP